ncbi:alpha/beta hydrolase [Jeotgalibacillus sp. S-D1]|uniref:alpha/beta fold hydrolase n=1 Tax=Jeotgalibacillus sp. S-D1 TaxID=2552189 RepID=UPI00105A2EF9|nr:alpha/beta hydrolase [Jeotgalibacillus sp. S-D1]TDL32523.1 alpha/beta hydrolase [Jeotgalibacillus sp. S-D1]
MNQLEFTKIKVNGVTLHTGTAGPEDGPLIVLLHGFPEFWYSWRHQIEPLVEKGYRVVVPDQRGYNLSDKPEEVSSYQLDELRDDVIGLIKHFGRDKSIIAGHDWGGIAAWHLASTRPEFVEKLIILNSPHPEVFSKVIRKSPSQLLRSWYVLFFQIPRLPEKLLQANDYEFLKKSLSGSGEGNAFKPNDINKYTAAWSQPNAVRSMINWYRGLSSGLRDQVSFPNIDLPVQIIWGYRDSFLTLQVAEESAKKCANANVTLVDATHWVQHEQPRIVNQFILDFIAK